MRIYIIGNDGITLGREATPELNEGEIAIGWSDDERWRNGDSKLGPSRAEEICLNPVFLPRQSEKGCSEQRSVWRDHQFEFFFSGESAENSVRKCEHS